MTDLNLKLKTVEDECNFIPGQLFAKSKCTTTIVKSSEQDGKIIENNNEQADLSSTISSTVVQRSANDKNGETKSINDNNGETKSKSSGCGGRSPLIVNPFRQKGNPLLKYMRNVVYEWGDIKPDFELGSGACAIYLTIKYHKLHPQYIETRFKEIGRTYALQILLAVVNIEEPRHVLRELNVWCLRAGWTLILAYSVEEAAEYIESFKIYEHKTVESVIPNETNTKPLKKDVLLDASKKGADLNNAIDILTSIRSVNRSDAQRLLGTFGSIKRIAMATVEELSLCPGLGQLKAQRIFDAFRQPFAVEEKGKNDNKGQKVIVE